METNLCPPETFCQVVFNMHGHKTACEDVHLAYQVSLVSEYNAKHMLRCDNLDVYIVRCETAVWLYSYKLQYSQ